MGRKFGNTFNDTYERKATSYERTRPTNTGQVTSRGSNPTVQQPLDKGKAPMNGSSKQIFGNDVCYKCHKKSHFAKQCPTRNLAIEREDKEEESGEEHPYIPEEVASKDELSMEEEENPTVNVMRCIMVTPQEQEDWRRTSIFHTYIKCGNKSCKMIMDGGSYMNVISK
ncbi:uncharacterized protein LOC131160807 [Malania oleifera]|uniref:uncharacterized protein LOC131160807 n=1 Tax=Malania oleifera TaxID=397392 RepID=UPI0025AE2E0F|nr:uncharacterized protein LOC131160807 [Malania oleifera]